ncbi:MAG: hypothetical protein K2Z80_36210 [Xanthobacteraceae bacterium]|nr:hypothetical protein [Xanthobacteraceae bacterium]
MSFFLILRNGADHSDAYLRTHDSSLGTGPPCRDVRGGRRDDHRADRILGRLQRHAGAQASLVKLALVQAPGMILRTRLKVQQPSAVSFQQGVISLRWRNSWKRSI